jgi:importin subunit beta-1
LTAILLEKRKRRYWQWCELSSNWSTLELLEFTAANFNKESERQFIVWVVCGATYYQDNKVWGATLQSLMKKMALYYQSMETHMTPALFLATIEVMNSDFDEVTL